MLNNRLIGIVVVGTVLVIAALLSGTGTATSAAVAPGAKDLSDYALRHPGAERDLSDYALRHPGTAVEISFPGKEMDDRVTANTGSFRGKEMDDGAVVNIGSFRGKEMDDGAVVNIGTVGRFPGKVKDDAVAKGGASDWFERHIDALSAANAADLSDYMQRHPTATILSAADAGDYAQRHPESLQSPNGRDLNDWFERHTTSNSR
jgi:hypothetical protein